MAFNETSSGLCYLCHRPLSFVCLSPRLGGGLLPAFTACHLAFCQNTCSAATTLPRYSMELHHETGEDYQESGRVTPGSTAPLVKPPPPLPPGQRYPGFIPRQLISPLCRQCGLYHLGNCLWNNALRPPQEPPPDDSSSSETSSGESCYSTSESEDERRAPDAVQHGPWILRENLPSTMQPQDGAFDHSSHIEGQVPYYRPGFYYRRVVGEGGNLPVGTSRQPDSSSSEAMPELVSDSDLDTGSMNHIESLQPSQERNTSL